jgi:dihydroflavonol-4-reductase
MSKGLVLVTGGSGYIAGYVVRQLIAEGWTVRASVRSLSREAEVRRTLQLEGAPGLSFVAADLAADAGWAEAAAGCDYVQHIASPLPTKLPKNDDELVIPARDGALRVLKAAKAAGVKRVVMTSSTAAITYGIDGDRAAPFTESDWTDPKHRDTSPYVRSKTIAERAAWDWHKAGGAPMELTTICPGAVLGPVLGADFSASIEIIKKLMEGSLPGTPRLNFPLVDVRDIADLHIRAMTAPGVNGERFLGAGPSLWMREMADVLIARMGAKAAKVPKSSVPDWLMKLLANFDPVTKSVVFEIGRKRDVDSSKAQRLLGWKMRPVADSIVETAQSLAALKLV